MLAIVVVWRLLQMDLGWWLECNKGSSTLVARVDMSIAGSALPP